MNHSFEILKTTRNNFLALTENLSLDDLNKIPANFNNNIIWNLGHIVSSQQSLCYKLSGLTPYVSNEFMAKYGKGSKPDGPVSQEEVDLIRSLAISLADKTIADYQAGLFKTYTEYTTSYGITLHNIDEAILFVNTHEGLHYGYAMALKRAIGIY